MTSRRPEPNSTSPVSLPMTRRTLDERAWCALRENASTDVFVAALVALRATCSAGDRGVDEGATGFDEVALMWPLSARASSTTRAHRPTVTTCGVPPNILGATEARTANVLRHLERPADVSDQFRTSAQRGAR